MMDDVMMNDGWWMIGGMNTWSGDIEWSFHFLLFGLCLSVMDSYFPFSILFSFFNEDTTLSFFLVFRLHGENESGGGW